MDNNKKIIVGVVGALMLIALVLIMKMTFFKSAPEASKGANKIAISIPAVDENQIEDLSKKEQYDKERIQKVGGDNPFFRNEREGDQKKIVKGLVFEDSEDDKESKPSKNKTSDTKSKKKKKKRRKSSNQQMNDDLMMIMAMQEQMEEEQNRIEQQQRQHQLEANYLNPGNTESTSDPYGKSNTSVSQGASGRFFGTVKPSKNKSVKVLIPAETVDRGIVSQNSTIAIRTKKEFTVEHLGITIPKNAVVYGKAQFQGPDRMRVNIESYKDNETLYALRLKVYDFDGREGVHLSSRTWTKIPAKVADDVFQYAYQKGTQQSAFGNNNTINLDEAGNIAALSAAKEISDEILKKRKVMMPKKYNLWIHIDTGRK